MVKEYAASIILFYDGLIILQFSIYIKPEFANMFAKGMYYK